MRGDVIVLASGPSVSDYNIRDLEMHGHLIAVNASALYCKPHTALSMDRRASEYCYPMWHKQGVPDIWIRKGIAKNFRVHKGTTEFECSTTSTQMFVKGPVLNGSNSGTCALNLAGKYEAARIFMLGFDMARHKDEGEPYWHPAYPWNLNGCTKNGKLAEWAAEFAAIAPQFEQQGIKVYNVNHLSVIKEFPVLSFEKFMEMT